MDGFCPMTNIERACPLSLICPYTPQIETNCFYSNQRLKHKTKKTFKIKTKHPLLTHTKT